jgi:YbgC/YbaW family acyl-CoA thioester hydrolase
MFFDTDSGGVVSNIAYLRFIEIARTALTEELGLRLSEMDQTKQYPAVVRTEIDYRRPANESLIAECRQMIALVQMPEGKVARLPKDWDKYGPDSEK